MQIAVMHLLCVVVCGLALSVNGQFVDQQTFRAFVADVSAKLGDCPAKVADFSSEAEAYKSRITILETRLDAAENKINVLENAALDSPISTSRHTPNSTNLTKDKRQVEVPANKIAFSAYLSATPTGIGAHHPIPFDKTQINQGNAFDQFTHHFRCPISGVYVFQSALLSAYHKSVETEIVLDGIVIANMYATGAIDSHGYDQGFNSVITKCNAGQSVWVQIHMNRGTTVYSEKYSTFSGYLLWEN